MLIDRATIIVRSGKGGDGYVGFRRQKYVPKGGPNGGDGGNGGSVYLVATAGTDTLLDLSGRHHWYADNGQPGMSKQCHGAHGDDLLVRVPPGTLVYDDTTGELLIDLDQPDMRLLAAKGGRGGWGNEHFKSATNQTPREATPGEPAEERTLRLELKLIADVGLIGMPNAGKSTLLSRISKARPKIADYPFTTLEPNLGIAELSDFRRLVFADIPGLIEGAHKGHGLGTQFLRHIERTRVLVHVLDIDPPNDSGLGDPVQNYHTVRKELEGYSPILADKPQLIVLNKADLLPSKDDLQAAIKMIEDELRQPTIMVSAVAGLNTGELLEACWKLARGSVNHSDNPQPQTATES